MALGEDSFRNGFSLSVVQAIERLQSLAPVVCRTAPRGCGDACRGVHGSGGNALPPEGRETPPFGDLPCGAFAVV